jgi:predicted enzyme related to lactoylglutathione lyase
MVTMSPVVHFEMPAEDRRRMASFYEKTFGWKTQMLGPIWATMCSSPLPSRM